MKVIDVLAVSAMVIVASCQSGSILEQHLARSSAEEICGAVRSGVYAQNRKMPSRISRNAEQVKLVAQCDRRTIAYTIRILLDENEFPPNWKSEFGKELRDIICRDEFMRTLKWNFETILLSRDDKLLARYFTRPTDCG